MPTEPQPGFFSLFHDQRWRFYLQLGITAKLVLTLMITVTFACAVTVSFIDFEVKKTYERFCEQQFDSQWQYFLAQEAGRFAEAKRLLQDALEEIKPEKNRTELDWSAFRQKLSKILLTTLAEAGYAPGGLAHGEPFFCWISPQHDLYKPVLTDLGYNMELQPAILEQNLDPLSQGKGDRFAYLILPTEDTSSLYQLIAAALPGEDTPDDLGDLVFGLPLKHLEELFGLHKQGVHTGVVLASQLSDSKKLPKTYTVPVQNVLDNLSDDHVELLGQSGQVTLADGDQALYYKKLPAQKDHQSMYQLAVFSLKDMQNFRKRIRLAIWGILPLIPLTGLIFSVFASRRMTRPIHHLVEATQAVGKGQYDIQVPVDRLDELGLLARSFNQMVQDLALKDRYRNILDQVTDKEVANWLLANPLKLSGELTDVSILFCDIRGFTHLSEQLSADFVLKLLNEHMSLLSMVAYVHHGVVDKFIGDAIMVIFGSPKSYGNDALHAAQAALDMMEKRNHLNQISEFPFKIGIGIASGRVVAGCVGSQERLNYTVVGSKVNWAARLCDQAAGDEILIDEATRARLGQFAHVEALPALHLKGITGSVPVFKLNEII